jgi:iron complex outermembrane receptor protein
MIAISTFTLLLLQFAGPVTADESALPPPAPAVGRDTNAGSDADPEMAELMNIINEETEVATKTRMNSDYVPGVVTVLQGEELTLLGMHTVWEALALVPGIQPILDPRGTPSMVVRGIEFPFNSGNVKILLDGVPLNRDMAGITGFILEFPIEEVERIEVIRGPGSVIHGDFAFMGVVNIISRTESTGVFARAHSNGLAGGGAMGSWKGTQTPLHLSASASGFRGHDYSVLAGRSTEQHQATAIFGLQTGGFTFSAHLLDHATNENTASSLTPVLGRLNAEEHDWSLDTRYEHDFTEKLRAGVYAKYISNNIGNEMATFDGDLIHVGSDITYSGWQRQSWFVNAEYQRAGINHALQTNPAPQINGILQPARLTRVQDEKREITSLTLQNQLDVSDEWSFTPGIRFDNYSDVANRFTPRFAVVWRASENHILKGQYAEGFRAPTFFELWDPDGRNSNLNFEVNRTTELHYTFRRPGTVFHATAFYTVVDDMIYRNVGSPDVNNGASATTRGMELEWTQQLSSWAKFIVNGTWFLSMDARNLDLVLRKDTLSPAWMSDAGLLLSPLEHTVLAPHWSHAAPTGVAGAGANDLLDFTVSRTNVVWKGFEGRIGVKNILDQDPRFVSKTPQGTRITRGTGRSYWLSLGWEL